jgi:hypothetical protein
MAFQPRDSRKQGAGQPALIERRSRVRFPFELRVQFRSLAPGYRPWGTGRLSNMSSGGLLVSSQHEMVIGTLVELNIDWPTRLDGRLPLQLVAAGTVTRCDPFQFAVVLERYHFRLAGGAAGKRREDQRPAAR